MDRRRFLTATGVTAAVGTAPIPAEDNPAPLAEALQRAVARCQFELTDLDRQRLRDELAAQQSTLKALRKVKLTNFDGPWFADADVRQPPVAP